MSYVKKIDMINHMKELDKRIKELENEIEKLEGVTKDLVAMYCHLTTADSE